MNYVAHQFLSFNIPEIQLGNLYGEIVRGNKFENYEGLLRLGILLHREIDTYTDSHPSTKKSSQKFYNRFNKYAPVIVDVLYDHLLIQNWSKFSDQTYAEYTTQCYQLFRANFDEFPPKLQYIIHHLLEHNWFHNYETIKGIQKTLKGISERSKFENEIYLAIEEFNLYYKDLENDFLEFFPEIINHCQSFIKKHEQISGFERIL